MAESQTRDARKEHRFSHGMELFSLTRQVEDF